MTTTSPAPIELVEVAPRDGFQSIADPLPTERKIEVIQALLEWAGEGRTLVMATHHPAVMTVANRHFVCRSGQLVEVKQ